MGAEEREEEEGGLWEEVRVKVAKGALVGVGVGVERAGECRVLRVMAGSEVRGRLREGDRLRRLDGRALSGEEGRAEVLLALARGSPVSLLVQRALKSNEEQTGLLGQGTEGEGEQGGGLVEGAWAQTVDWRVGRAGLGLEERGRRVLVRSVEPGSLAAAAGLRPGQRLLAVNGLRVSDAHVAAAEMRRSGGVVELVLGPAAEGHWPLSRPPPRSAGASLASPLADYQRIALALRQELRELGGRDAGPGILLRPGGEAEGRGGPRTVRLPDSATQADFPDSRVSHKPLVHVPRGGPPPNPSISRLTPPKPSNSSPLS